MMRKPKVGEKVMVKDDPSGSIYKIMGFTALGYIWIKKTKLRNQPQIEVLEENIVFLDKETIDGRDKFAIIERWTDPNYINDGNRLTQLVALNGLIEKYPNVDFWKEFHPTFKVKNLFWYRGAGADKLQIFYHSFSKDLTEITTSVNLELTKVGEDFEIKTSPKSVMDLYKC